MVSAREADAQKLISAASIALQDHMNIPGWAKFVKTGMSRERPPEQHNWWHIRAASLLRKIYIEGPVGVQKLRSYYGGLKNNGHQPAHFAKGGGKILRVMLQDFEKMEYVKKEKKGRSIAPKGQKFLDGIAKQVKST
ncbi:MAG: 30S ribosomal protein S19e [Candidatus Aenigmarchaeota archaeon]|nr:30S ribosomal protein S19e [Candidatus Aenigmarchaeota archaeon]